MRSDAIYARQIHDAAIALGASCPDDCWFGGAQDRPDDYDSYGKSVVIDRAKALAFLAELTN